MFEPTWDTDEEYIDAMMKRFKLLYGELNDALSGRLFYADFRFPQGYQSL